MKKQTILLVAIVAGMASSSFAQGYAIFGTSGKNFIYDDFTTPGSSVVSSGTANVAFLIGATGQTPLIDSAIGASNPTSNTNTLSATAWSDILNDQNFSLGYNYNSGSPSLCVVLDNTSTLAKGGINYNAGGTFQVNGYTSIASATAVEIYVIAWNASYATPALAAANNAAVGWSAPFTYSLSASLSSPPSNMSASGLTAFGVSQVTTIPEPATMALFGLGGLSVLLFRRRK